MPIQYVVTKNPALLAQYYELRNRIYRRHYPHLPEDFGHEEATDHVSDIVVAYDGCVVADGRHCSFGLIAELVHTVVSQGGAPL
jgi:hypothetical protein